MANGDETQGTLEPLSGKCLDDKSAHRVVLHINGRQMNNIAASLHFVVLLEHGTNEDDDPCIKLGRVVKVTPLLIWKGEMEGQIKREVTGLNRKMRCIVQTVTKKVYTNEASMLHIVKKTLRHAIPCLPKSMHPLPLPSKMPICGFTSRPRIVRHALKHVTKKWSLGHSNPLWRRTMQSGWKTN